MRIRLKNKQTHKANLAQDVGVNNMAGTNCPILDIFGLCKMRDVGSSLCLATAGILSDFRTAMKMKLDSNISVEGISQKVAYTQGVAPRFIQTIRSA